MNWKNIDILNLNELNQIFIKFNPTHVVHLAARTDCDENTTLEKGYEVNIRGTANILEVVKNTSSIEKLIIASTQFVYKSENEYDYPKNSDSTNCIILANGPSLNSDIEKFSHILDCSDILCVNNFPTTDLFEKIKPKFYMFTDPAYWGENPGEFLLNYRKLIFESIRDKTNWNMKIFHPVGSDSIIEYYELTKNKYISTYKFNYTPISGFKIFREFCYKHNIGTPMPGNILIPALINMLNKGYKYIYIAGSDHSMFKNIYIDKDNSLYKESRHFYGKGKKRKLYSYTYLNGMVNDKVGLRMSEYLFNFASVFQCHEIIEEYSKSLNTKIINLTEKSYIDSYSKK